MAEYEYQNYVKLPGEKRGTITNKYKNQQLPAGSTKVTSTIAPEGIGELSNYKRIITYGATPQQNDTTYMYNNKVNPFAKQYFAPIEKQQKVKSQISSQPLQTNSDPVYYTETKKVGGKINYMDLFN